MSTGYPDGQKITQWIGAPIAQAVAAPIGAGQIVIGPTRLSSWASIIVALKPTGGQVTITVTQTVPNGPPGLTLQQQVVVPAGSTVFQSLVLFGANVTITLQGAVGGTTVDYAVTPSNTTTNAQVLTNATINVQRNEVLVAAEPTLDFVDAGGQYWGVADDAANTRVKLSPPRQAIRSNGQVSIVNIAGLQALFSTTIPAGVLGATGAIRCTVIGDYYNATGAGQTLQLGIVFGAAYRWADTWAVNMESAAVRRPFLCEFTIANLGGTGSQFLVGAVSIGDHNGAPANGAGKMNGPINDANTYGRYASFSSGGGFNVDTTLAQALRLDAAHGAANANLEIRQFFAIAEIL